MGPAWERKTQAHVGDVRAAQALTWMPGNEVQPASGRLGASRSHSLSILSYQPTTLEMGLRHLLHATVVFIRTGSLPGSSYDSHYKGLCAFA